MLGHAQETPGFVGSGDFALDSAVGRPGLLPSPQDTFFHQIQRLRALGYLVEERAAEPCRKSVARAGRKKRVGIRLLEGRLEIQQGIPGSVRLCAVLYHGKSL